MPRIMNVPCAGCGISIAVGVGTRKPRHCKACREARYVTNLVSLVQRAGPEYELYRAKQREGYERWRRGGGGQKKPINNGDSV